MATLESWPYRPADAIVGGGCVAALASPLAAANADVTGRQISRFPL